MDYRQAYKISLVGYLASLGHFHTEEKNGRFKYHSPLRTIDKTASFFVFYNKEKNKWQWKDFGETGKGGDIIDLVMKLRNVTETGALLILDNPELSVNNYLSLIGSEYQENKTEIVHIQPLQNRALLQYLTSRNINPKLADKYCEELYYKTYPEQIKPYFSVGFKNNSGGYDLRNGFRSVRFPEGYKGSTTPKDIKTIPGKNNFAVNVFEGFTDFLSALTYFKTDRANCDTIVLNGVGFIEKFISLLPGYSKINLYLDNDLAGREAANRVQSVRPDAVNRSQIIYPKHKDFNEFLTNQK